MKPDMAGLAISLAAQWNATETPPGAASTALYEIPRQVGACAG